MEKKGTLLQLNVTANWGSTGKIAEGIGVSAIADGWESFIAYGRMMNPSKSKLLKVGNQLDVYLHYAKNRLLDGEGLGSKSATKELIHRIQELSPQVIHLHNIHDHWLNYPLLFEYFSTIDTPIVWTFHDCWAFTGHCCHFEDEQCFKWRTDCMQCPQCEKYSLDRSKDNFNRKKALFTKLQDRLTIVCVSEWLANYVRQSFLDNCRIEVLNNGIDSSTFSIQSSRSKKKMILGVSNVWPPYKGLGDFIELRKRLPSDVGITLVGLTEKQISDLPDGIKGITRTTNVQELVALYNEASVFVNPTYNDSFPTVNLEALACGTPIITYRTGGSPEAVDEATGMVIEKGDVEGLASAILKVVNNPALYPPSACRKRAVERFNKETQFAKYINLYTDLVNRKN